MKRSRSSAVYLTVGDFRSKELCESVVPELESRYNIRICVISDDDFGCRIGSGGAVLKVIAENCGENEKIIIINSGGMSKRAVNFALKGKALAGIKSNGEALLMLDVLLSNALKLSEKLESGALVCCSDIPIDASEVNSLPEGCIGFCIATDESVGSRHGVLFSDENSKLILFAHKKTVPELKALMNRFGRKDVLTDTGWVFLDSDFCQTAKKTVESEKLLEKMTQSRCEINLYSDILPLMIAHSDAEGYCKSADVESDEIKKLLFSSFSGYTLKSFELKNQKFLHFGTIKEYLSNSFLLSGKKEDFLKINSSVDATAEVGEGTVLDNALIKGACRIGSGCLISDISLSDVTVPRGKSVCGFRQADGTFITAVCDVTENPKETVSGIPLWDTPRFYKGKSFSESYLKYVNGCNEEKFSLQQCVENADYKYFCSFYKYLQGLQDISFNQVYAEKRERLLTEFFKERSALKTAECVQDKAEICLPVRVNLSGTWSDAMPYCIDNGGAVVNAAVTVDGRLPIRVTAEKLDSREVEFVSDSSKLTIDRLNSDAQEYFSDFNLHFAALKTMGIDSSTVLKNGFRLTTCVTGLEKGSGLGTSSILLAGCFKAMGELFGLNYSDSEIIGMVFAAEQIMKTGGGWQDQVGALFPGVKVSFTQKGIEQKVAFKEIRLPEKMKALFNDRAILVPTGERHFGRFVVSDVADRYLNGIPEAVQAFERIKKLNDFVVQSIEESDEKQFFECINRHCDLLKQISPKVTNPKIDCIIARLKEETEAVSICGAGAGGYLLTFMKNGDDIKRIREILKNEFPHIKAKVLKISLY